MQIPYLGLLQAIFSTIELQQVHQWEVEDVVVAWPNLSFALLHLVSGKVGNRKHDCNASNASLFWRGAFVGKCSQRIHKDMQGLCWCHSIPVWFTPGATLSLTFSKCLIKPTEPELGRSSWIIVYICISFCSRSIKHLQCQGSLCIMGQGFQASHSAKWKELHGLKSAALNGQAW